MPASSAEGASAIALARTLRALKNLAVRLSKPAYRRRYLAAAVVCALLLAVTRVPLVLKFISRPITLSAPVAVHHASIQGNTIALGPANETHAEAGWQAAIRPGHEYRIELEVDNPEPLLPVTLYGDLYGPGYDNRAGFRRPRAGRCYASPDRTDRRFGHGSGAGFPSGVSFRQGDNTRSERAGQRTAPSCSRPRAC